MNKINLNKILDILSSLKLTIFSLAALMILIFIATLRQSELGIYFIKKEYFQPFFVTWNHIPVFLGGFSIGLILFINLLFAHLRSFKWKPSKIGIWITHLGILILVAGSAWVCASAVESQMTVEEGRSANYSESLTSSELAVVTPFDDARDKVISFPVQTLSKGGIVSHPDLPFKLRIVELYPNSTMAFRTPEIDAPPSLADQGLGPRFAVMNAPINKKNDSRNFPSAFVEILDKNNQPLGIWLLSGWLNAKQSIRIDGRDIEIYIRPKRYYNTYAIHLDDFRHDVYAGTEIPKNFSSVVRVLDPQNKEELHEIISMNHPLRYRGKTFYQASFGKSDTVSILQVVKNSGWWLPYVSCALVALGLIIHFGLVLTRHLRKTWA